MEPDALYFLLQKNEDVEKSQTSFLVLVQNLLKNPNERKRFFKVSTSVSVILNKYEKLFYEAIEVELKDNFDVVILSYFILF